MYKLDNHRYPTTNQGLESLVEAPTLPPLAANYNKEGYIKRLPADPRGNDYVLVNPGEHGAYDLLSAGPDGEMGTEDDITNWGFEQEEKSKSAMNQQRGFTLLEMMLVLALVAITASVVLFTYGREDAANTRARETAARFTAALELAIDRATLSGQPVGIHFSDSAWRIMVPGKNTISLGAGFHYKKMPQTRAKNDWDEELSIHLQPFKPDDSNQPQVVILADGQITPFSLLMANAGDR